MPNKPDQSHANPAPTGGVFRSGRDLNDMICEDGATAVADLIENGDDRRPDPVDWRATEPQDEQSASPRSWGFDVREINRSYALTVWGGKTVVVNEQPAGPVNDRVRVMSFESMNTWFANRITEVVGADGKIKSVTWARAWLTHHDRREYDGVEFFPNPDGAKGTPGYLNLWRGFSVQPSEDGTCDRFKDHLLANVCNGDPEIFKYVFGWMAHIVQRPRERLGVALVLRGRRGTGKSKLGEVLGSLFSPHHFQVDDPRYITGNFNAHMASCLLLQADEAIWAGDKQAEGRLKGLITSETQMIESKGVDPIRLNNYSRVLMTSNETWTIPAGPDERRWCVLDVASHSEQNNVYFREMNDELDAGGRSRLLHELLAFDLSQVNLWTIPKTKALLDQKVQSLDSVDGFWFNRLWEGTLQKEDERWRQTIPRTSLYNAYIDHCKNISVGRRRDTAEFGKKLHKLIPSVRDTRPSMETGPGVTERIRCYEFPTISECRAAFDQFIGQRCEWPALPPGESERATADPADDEFPG